MVTGLQERTRFYEATPSGEIKLGTVNAEAAAQFELDRSTRLILRRPNDAYRVECRWPALRWPGLRGAGGRRGRACIVGVGHGEMSEDLSRMVSEGMEAVAQADAWQVLHLPDVWDSITTMGASVRLGA